MVISNVATNSVLAMAVAVVDCNATPKASAGITVQLPQLGNDTKELQLY